MAKKETIEQFTANMKKLSKDLNKAILPPFRWHLQTLQKALARGYWSVRFGERIWKWQKEVKGDPHGAPSIKIGSPGRRRYARWSSSENAFVGKVFVFGLAAKIEEGGDRLRKHVMWGRKEWISPGVMVPHHAVMDRVHEQIANVSVRKMSEEFGKFVERTL